MTPADAAAAREGDTTAGPGTVRADGSSPSGPPPDVARLLAATFPGYSDMAARCRALDWAATPLGSVAAWPAALRTLVRTCVASPFPVNLWCGDALVLVYNDAYRRVLGAKHPAAIGRPGLEVWAEIRAEVEPMFAQIRAGGPPVYAEDARFVMVRGEGVDGSGGGTKGGVEGGEDAYFTFGLSAVRDEAGAVVAFFNPATETTGRVLAERRLAAANGALGAERERLRAMILQAPVPMALHEGPEHRYTLVNAAYKRVSGARPDGPGPDGGGRDVTGLTLREAFPEVAGQGIYEAFDRVYATGEPWVGPETHLRHDRRGLGVEDAWYNLRYDPVRDGEGRVTGVLNFSVDVTEQVRARREVERLLAESEAARDAAEAAAAAADLERRRLATLLDQQ